MKKCKIRIVKALEGVFAKYQPEIGKIYDADYSPKGKRKAEAAVIEVNGKLIVARKGEFEVVGL